MESRKRRTFTREQRFQFYPIIKSGEEQGLKRYVIADQLNQAGFCMSDGSPMTGTYVSACVKFSEFKLWCSAMQPAQAALPLKTSAPKTVAPLSKKGSNEEMILSILEFSLPAERKLQMIRSIVSN